MERPVPDAQSNFEMSLRDQLIAAQNGSTAQSAGPTQHPSISQNTSIQEDEEHNDSNNHNDHNENNHIEPIMDPHGHHHYVMPGMGVDAAGRRELSSSKRAAQNRAAQRAFRQRKEAYITKLEKQVKDYRDLEHDYKTLSAENYQLREYVLSLQSRILETSADLPPAPASVDLTRSRTALREQQQPSQQQYQAQPQRPSSQDMSDHQQPTSRTSDRAPVAAMASGPTTSLPQAAVDQLKAAAAEAGQLGRSNATKTEA